MTLLGLFVLFSLLAVSACGGDNSVKVYDNARVLNVSKVQNAASHLSNPVAIYTTNTFQGTHADFQRVARQKLNGNPNLIVMAIDTSHHYIYITRGSNVALSGAGISQAVGSFSSRFNNGDYTNASVAALNSMHNSISSNSSSRANSSGGSFTAPSLACCIIPILIVLGLIFFAASRRGRMGGTMVRQNPFGWRFPTEHGPYDMPHDVPPDQEPYPNQGPYPSQPNRGSGINPWAAGGLGAAAGGLAGYELGKRQSERESWQNENGDNFAQGGNFGGENAGGGGNFGNDDFGWGNAGRGGNFGGDDFGGGDMGGGGSFGNDDFGQEDDAGGGNF